MAGKRGGERRGREPLYLALLCLLLLLNFPAGEPADEINRLAVLPLQVRRIGHFPESLNASFGTARHCPQAPRGRAGAARGSGGVPDPTCPPPALICPPTPCPSPLRYGLPPESVVVRGRSARGKGVVVLGFLIYFYFIFYSGVFSLLFWVGSAMLLAVFKFREWLRGYKGAF